MCFQWPNISCCFPTTLISRNFHSVLILADKDNLLQLLWLFSKKTLRYFYNPGVVGIVVMQKLWHFLMSLSLLKIFTWKADWLLTIKRGTRTSRAGSPQTIFDIVRVCALFDLEFSKSSWALAPACGALVVLHGSAHNANLHYFLTYRHQHWAGRDFYVLLPAPKS